jgi:prevent-host-death family protein
MKIFNIHEAKTHLSRLLEAVAAGEEILIARAGKPVARLVPVAGAGQPRVLGALTGAVRESADCWEPDPVLDALFSGGGAGAEAESGEARRVAEPRQPE